MNDFESLDENEHKEPEAGCAPPAAENEDLDTECEDEDSEPEWLGHLREEAPGLNLPSLFIPAAKRQVVKLTRDEFRGRLARFLERFGHKLEQEALVDELFQYAIADYQQMAAFLAYCKGLQSRRFRQTKSFVDKALTKLRKIKRLSGDLRCSLGNDHVEEWETFWFGGLQEIVEKIAAELRGQKRLLAEHEKYLKFGRTQLESHLLRSRHADIEKLVIGEPFSRHLTLLLAAYAHASGLVPNVDTTEDSEFIDAIKMRVHRAKRSTTARQALGLVLIQAIAE